MKILLIVIGKTDRKWLEEGIGVYSERISHFAQFDILVIPDQKNTRNMDASVQKEREGESVLRLLQPGDDVCLLDDKGSEMTSTQMASWLEKRISRSSKRLVFITVLKRPVSSISIAPTADWEQPGTMVWIMYRAALSCSLMPMTTIIPDHWFHASGK